MTKKTFNDSFKEGMGGEMGKRTGSLVFGLIVLVILSVFGIKSCDAPSSTGTPSVKQPGNNGNVQ